MKEDVLTAAIDGRAGSNANVARSVAREVERIIRVVQRGNQAAERTQDRGVINEGGFTAGHAVHRNVQQDRDGNRRQAELNEMTGGDFVLAARIASQSQTGFVTSKVFSEKRVTSAGISRERNATRSESAGVAQSDIAAVFEKREYCVCLRCERKNDCG